MRAVDRTSKRQECKVLRNRSLGKQAEEFLHRNVTHRDADTLLVHLRRIGLTHSAEDQVAERGYGLNVHLMEVLYW